MYSPRSYIFIMRGFFDIICILAVYMVIHQKEAK